MGIQTQTEFVSILVIHRVEVSQEECAHEVHVRVDVTNVSLVDHEEASVFVRHEQVLVCVQMEHVVTKLEGDWLHFLDHLFAWLLDMTEGVALLANEIWHVLLPLSLEILEDWRWN